MKDFHTLVIIPRIKMLFFEVYNYWCYFLEVIVVVVVVIYDDDDDVARAITTVVQVRQYNKLTDGKQFFI